MKAPVHPVSRSVLPGHGDDLTTVGSTDITIEAASHLHLAPVPAEEGVIRPQRSLRVVLADGHSLMRRGLRLLLDGEDEVEVIAEAVDLASAVRLVHSHRPHVLVLDLGMSDGSSIERISELRERVPETQIVVLTMDDSPVFAQRALAAGSLGFVLEGSRRR